MILLIWISYFEVFLGKMETLLLFVISGTVGNMIAIMFNKNDFASLGASTGVFGLMGCALGYLILNWFRIPKIRFTWLV